MKAKRLLILAALLVGLVGSLPTVVAAQDPAPAQPPAQAQPQQQPPAAQPPAAQPPATVAPAPANPSVNVQVTRTEETAWYMNPVLIGLGVLVLIVLVVLASRGGEPTSSTTIVKD
jgi:hypothetical protein